VKVSPRPPPRRAITTPSNAWRRVFSPSLTRTITLTVSPASNFGMSVRSPSRATCSISSSPIGTSFSRVCAFPASGLRAAIVALRGRERLPQVGPAFPGESLRLLLPPRGDGRVIPREQDPGHLVTANLSGSGVTGRTEQPIVMRVGACRLVIADGPRQQPDHGVDHAQCRRLTARQHEISDRYLFGTQDVDHSLVDVLVVATHDGELFCQRPSHCIVVSEASS